MSRITFVGLPFQGHNSGLGRIASALHARGHDVLLVFPQGAPDGPRLDGVRYEAANVTQADVESGVESIAELRDPERRARLLSEFLLGGLAHDIAFVTRALHAERPDVVLCDPMSFSGAIGATRAKVPWLALATDFSMVSGYAEDDPFRQGVELFEPALRAATSELSYDGEFRAALAVSPHLNLIPGAGEWFSPDGDVRFAPVGMAEPRPTGALTRKMPGAPLVLIVFGTVVQLESSFVRELMEVGRHLPNVEFLVGARTDDEARFSSLPPNVQWQPFVPQIRALQEASLVVHHGGANSFLESVYFEVPQIILPLHSDQFGSGALGERLGVATALDTSSISASTLARHVATALSARADPHAAARRRKAADELRAVDYLDAVTRLTLSTARSRP